jgi:hypothetical protein
MTHKAIVNKLYTTIYILSVSDQKNTNIKNRYGGRGENPYSHFFLAFSYCNLYLKMNKNNMKLWCDTILQKISCPYHQTYQGGYGLTSPAWLTNQITGLAKMVWFYGVKCHFQQYFNYIEAVSYYWWSCVLQFGGHREKYRPVVNHWQTLSHNVLRLSVIGIRTHNISGDSRWLQR